MKMQTMNLSLAAASVLCAGLALGACAANTVTEVTDDDGATSSSTSSSTAGSGGSMGPSTASVGGGGSGGSVEPSPCGIDCSTISTPTCKVATCNPDTKQCEVVADTDGTTCDDGLFCTVDEVCQAGECGGGVPNGCGMTAAECASIVCDETSKSCKEEASADGASCSSSDLCQVNSTCSNGLCVGITKDCFFAPVPSDCYVAKCNPANGMCEPEVGNEGGACSDPTDLCTVSKTCSMGTCVGGSPKDCSKQADSCNSGVCDTITGICGKSPLAMGTSCPVKAECNIGKCDGSGSCMPEPAANGAPCEDGNSCTTGETCNAGLCSGGVSAQQTIYFEENFKDNSQGWTLGTEWNIGPAMVSNGEGYGGPDPGQDNTVTSDNGIAGVVIGGNASTLNVHGWYWLESPAIDLSMVTGTAWLQFRRWLNSDYTPYMQNAVEVWNGNTWVQIWATAGSPGIQDSAWEQLKYDIGQYKNNAFKVRFGFQIGSTGVFTVSSWNLDDVVVANIVCP